MTSILTQATVAALNGSLGSADVAVRNISVSQSGGALSSRGCLPQLVLLMAKSSNVNSLLDSAQLQRDCCSLEPAGGQAAARNVPAAAP